MKPVSGKTTTITGAYLLPRAKSLAAQLLKSRGWGKREIINGYLLLAKRVGDRAQALVLDPPGDVVGMDLGNDKATWLLPVGSRDQFRDGTATGAWYQPEPGVTFVGAPDPAFATAAPMARKDDAAFLTTHHGAVLSGQLRVTGAAPFGLDGPAAAGAQAFAVVRRGGKAYTIIPESVVAQLAPGYGLAKRAPSGFMDLRYQTGVPVAVEGAGGTLVVLPVVEDTGPDVVHWGRGALLLALLVETEDGLLPQWSHLWSPDAHPSDFFHNGSWIVEPANVAVGLDPAWIAWWVDWVDAGRPQPAGGSRPVWMDSVSACWTGNEFVVNFRLAAVNGVPAASQPTALWAVSGAAAIRLTVAANGAVSTQYRGHEVLAAPWSPSFARDDTAYQHWVVGKLPATALLRLPVATLMAGDELVEVDWVAEGVRANAANDAISFPYLSNTARFELRVSGPDGARAFDYPFTALGFYGPAYVELIDGPMLLLPKQIRGELGQRATPTHPGQNHQFAALAPGKLAVVMVNNWLPAFKYGVEASAGATPGTAYLVVFDLLTGAAETRGELGAVQTDLWNSRSPHLSCVQRAEYDAEGNETSPATLIYSSGLRGGIQISRDSGRTWQPLEVGTAVWGGAYYAGNQLAAARAGAAFK